MRTLRSFVPLLVAVALAPYACGRGKASRDAATDGDGGPGGASGAGVGGAAGGRGGNVSGGAGGGAAGSAGTAGTGNDGGTAGGGGTAGAGNAAGSGGCGGTAGGAPGACACPPGLLSCGGACVPSNSSHCGDCTTTCGNGQVCVNEACACPRVCSAAAGSAFLRTVVTVATARRRARPAEVCVLDRCVARCPAAETVCPNGACVQHQERFSQLWRLRHCLPGGDLLQGWHS